MRSSPIYPPNLVHGDLLSPSLPWASVQNLLETYCASLAFHQSPSAALRSLRQFCNEYNGNAFSYEAFLSTNREISPTLDADILDNQIEFEAVFKFLHPSTRIIMETISPAESENFTLITLIKYGSHKAFKSNPDGSPESLSLTRREFENLPSIKAAAADMRTKLRLPENEPLRDLFSQNTLFTVFNENSNNLLKQGDILVEKAALIEMIDGFYDHNQFYNTFHFLPPFRETAISETTLTQLPVATADKVRGAKRQYMAAQNEQPSLEFLSAAQDILIEMAAKQPSHRIFLSNAEAETELGELNQRLVLLVANELEANPRLCHCEIQGIHFQGALTRLQLGRLLQEQSCIKVRQIYMWKFLFDNRARFPAANPLILPPLVEALCGAESYDYAQMFEQALPGIQRNPRVQEQQMEIQGPADAEQRFELRIHVIEHRGEIHVEEAQQMEIPDLWEAEQRFELRGEIHVNRGEIRVGEAQEIFHGDVVAQGHQMEIPGPGEAEQRFELRGEIHVEEARQVIQRNALEFFFARGERGVFFEDLARHQGNRQLGHRH